MFALSKSKGSSDDKFYSRYKSWSSKDRKHCRKTGKCCLFRKGLDSLPYRKMLPIKCAILKADNNTVEFTLERKLDFYRVETILEKKIKC